MLRGVLIVGDTESDIVKSLSTYLPEKRCSYMIFKDMKGFIPEHLDTVIFCDTKNLGDVEKILKKCQEHRLNVLSLFKIDELLISLRPEENPDIPVVLNFAINILDKKAHSNHEILLYVKQLKEVSQHMQKSSIAKQAS
jgi:hypothetical protein